MRTRRHSSAAVFALLCVALAAVGCNRDSGDSAASGQAQPSPQAPHNAMLDVPMQGCTRSVASVGRLVEVASIAPPEYRDEPEPQDRDWLPVVLRDVAPLGEKLVVLDWGAKSLTVFGPDFRTRHTFGREGGGPGELRNPAAVAVNDHTRQILVADPGNGRISIFDSTGMVVDDVLTDAGSTVKDLAIGVDSVWLSHTVVPGFMQGPTQDRVLSAQRLVQMETTPVVTAAAEPWDPDRFPMPGFNDFQVVASGGYQFLFSPAGGVIDVLQGGGNVGVIRACVPSALADGYEKQRALSTQDPRQGSQRFFHLVTDILVRRDTVYVVGPLPDQEGRLHIDRFLLDGTDVGSLVAPLYDGFMWPSDIRFWGDEVTVVGFRSEGILVRLRLELRE